MSERLDELNRAIVLVGHAGVSGSLPPDVALRALLDQCRAAWSIDDDERGLVVGVAVALLLHASSLPSGPERVAAIGSAFGVLENALW